jgi:hypothetical protein
MRESRRLNVALIGFEEQALLISAPEAEEKINKNTWIAGTGASGHVAHSVDGLCDAEPIKKPIKVGNKKVAWSVARRKKDMIIEQKDGTETRTTLKDVLVVPELGARNLGRQGMLDAA